MLNQLGITDADFSNYLGKLCSFLSSLEPSQRDFYNSHCGKNSVEDVAKALGPDVTAADIESLFAQCPPVNGICVMGCCDGDDDGDDDDELSSPN
jgi:hypothetical protein